MPSKKEGGEHLGHATCRFQYVDMLLPGTSYLNNLY